MKTKLSHMLLVAAILAAGFGFAGCGDPGVAGSTYGDSDNLISLEFLPGGKATLNMAGASSRAPTRRKGKT